jgi:drug/metabolite transporter (DMT)-like permease
MADPIVAFRRTVDHRGPSGVYVLLLVQQLLASGTHIVAKVITDVMDPFALTLVRSLISTVIMGGILLLRGGWPKVAPGDRKLIFLLSFLAIPLNQFFFLFGMRYTIPSNAALLYATTPILVLLLSWLFLGERLTGRKVLGVIVGFVGVMIVIFERGVSASLEFLVGNLLISVAVIAWGLYSVFGKRLIARYGAVRASSLTLIYGTVMFLPIGLWSTVTFPYASLTGSNWGEILYLGIITSVVSYFLWYFALGRIEAGKVALFSNFQPILTTVLMVLILGQGITPAFVVGGTIALGGVVLAQFG